jgi:hypothetical protein
MSHLSHVLLSLILAAAPAASAEKGRPSATKGAGPSPASSKVDNRARTKVAVKWADAFRRRDLDSLIKLTVFPFALRDTGTAGQCTSGTAPDASKMKATISCMMSVDVVHDDLVSERTLEGHVLPRKSIPKWAKPWASDIPTDATPISVAVPGNGASHQFILLVATDGVQGVWKTSWFDSN